MDKRINKGLKGAITGDIIGSVYERHNIKTKDFPLFSARCSFTDDSVMSCAVAKAFMNAEENRTELYGELVRSMQAFGRRYPHAGYGGHFRHWLRDPMPLPYGSWGNGAPMRCSPAGMVALSSDEAYALGRETAKPTHNHRRAMAAAGLTASLIWEANHGASMDRLRIIAEGFYTIPTCGELRPDYDFDVSSQGTMPAVLAAFFESSSFEDAIRNAISLGGDSDTVAAITGSLAEAYWGIPEEIWGQASGFLNDDLRMIVDGFYAFANKE